jgi:hypothetical protein
MLKTAYNQGVRTAFTRFKLAGPMGADMPPGSMGAHGTDFKIPYPPGKKHEPNTNTDDSAAETRSEDRNDRLWNISDIDNLAPGGAGGQYGEEVIG